MQRVGGEFKFMVDVVTPLTMGNSSKETTQSKRQGEGKRRIPVTALLSICPMFAPASFKTTSATLYGYRLKIYTMRQDMMQTDYLR